jgi:elongation factor P
MVLASELREGMIIRVEGQTYKVLEVEAKAGAAKMGGVVKTKLVNVRGGRMWEPHFRPQERLEDLELERHVLEFLFAQDDTCIFMYPDTYQQVEVPTAILGPGERFLQPGIEVPVVFFENEPIGVVLPEIAEVRVAETAPAVHSQQDGAWKEATLENGLVIRVPLFIGPGETVRVEVKTGRYLERVRAERKRTA